MFLLMFVDGHEALGVLVDLLLILAPELASFHVNDASICTLRAHNPSAHQR